MCNDNVSVIVKYNIQITYFYAWYWTITAILCNIKLSRNGVNITAKIAVF